MPVIEINNLTKLYGEFVAVNDLTFSVDSGEIFGFLGPNGAGKTTTIRILMGMLIPTEGSCSIHGYDCERDRVEVKKQVGYLPDHPTFQDYVTGREILEFTGRMHGLDGAHLNERISELLEELDLAEAENEFALNYSSGMKKKLAFACARIHEPDVYILDELMRGLDPRASREIQDWIRARAEENKTIFLSTHILERAENLCTRVGIVHDGSLLKEGASDDIRQTLRPGGTLEEVFLSLTEETDQSDQSEEPTSDRPSDVTNH